MKMPSFRVTRNMGEEYATLGGRVYCHLYNENRQPPGKWAMADGSGESSGRGDHCLPPWEHKSPTERFLDTLPPEVREAVEAYEPTLEDQLKLDTLIYGHAFAEITRHPDGTETKERIDPTRVVRHPDGHYEVRPREPKP